MKTDNYKVLVLILGVLSCCTIIGIFWGMPMIGWALDRNWVVD